jgi:hypothetical protein
VHCFEDALGDGGDGGFVGEDYYAALVALRYCAVLLVDAGVEGVVFALEAVFVGAGLLGGAVVAAAGSAEGAGQGWEQEDGEVGLYVVADGAVHGEDAVGAEAAAGTLVGLGGVGVAVAEDDGAFGQCGEDDLAEGLSAVGEHEGHLGFGGDVAESGFAARVEEDGADAVAEGCAAGLAEGDDAVSVGFECGGEVLELRGLAGAVEAFKGDEECLGHDASLLHGGGLGLEVGLPGGGGGGDGCGEGALLAFVEVGAGDGVVLLGGVGPEELGRAVA